MVQLDESQSLVDGVGASLDKDDEDADLEEGPSSQQNESYQDLMDLLKNRGALSASNCVPLETTNENDPTSIISNLLKQSDSLIRQNDVSVTVSVKRKVTLADFISKMRQKRVDKLNNNNNQNGPPSWEPSTTSVNKNPSTESEREAAEAPSNFSESDDDMYGSSSQEDAPFDNETTDSESDLPIDKSRFTNLISSDEEKGATEYTDDVNTDVEERNSPELDNRDEKYKFTSSSYVKMILEEMKQEKSSISKSKFIDTEAEEEDDRGIVISNTDDREASEEMAAIYDELLHESHGLIDDDDRVQDEQSDSLRGLYAQQVVSQSIEDTEALMEVIDQRKRDRQEQKELRLMLKKRYGKNRPNIEPLSMKSSSMDHSVLGENSGNENAENDDTIQFRLWKEQQLLKERTISRHAPSNPLASPSPKFLYKKVADTRHRSIQTPFLYGKSEQALSRLEEISSIRDKKTATFKTENKPK